MSNIYYGIEEKNAETFDDTTLKSDIATLKSDVAATKSDLSAEKLKVSTNKTNISVNKAAITSEKSKLTRTRTLMSNLSTQVTLVENTASSNTTKIGTNTSAIATEKARITVNANKITAVESKAETNRQGILITPTSQINYHIYIPDLSNSYRTMENVPSAAWPAHVMQFGSIDNRTTFRLIGIVADEDVVIPSANFSVSFLVRAYTATGGSSDAILWTLNLSSYQISGKPWFCINKDITLRTKFPTGNLKCGQLYLKHNHGARNISVEMIVTFAVIQF